MKQLPIALCAFVDFICLYKNEITLWMEFYIITFLNNLSEIIFHASTYIIELFHFNGYIILYSVCPEPLMIDTEATYS